MNDPNDFENTGNQIPLKVDELVNFVHERLNQYDNLVETTQGQPTYSPYREPIIYTSPEGKMVQIPKEVQKKAIDSWKNRKTQLKGSQDLEKQRMMIEQERLGISQYQNNYSDFNSSNLLIDNKEQNPIQELPVSNLHNESENYYHNQYPNHYPNQYPKRQNNKEIIVVKENSDNILYFIILIISIGGLLYILNNKK